MTKLSFKDKTYEEQNHIYGRIWGALAAIILSCYPLVVAIVYDAWPGFQPILACAGTIAIFWLAGVVEMFTYIPMLGAVSGGYLGFVTGNLSNLKVPCALNCMDGANVKSGTPEGEVVAIISTAVSSIVTVLIIAVGVCLMIPFSEELSSPVLNPAFENVLPALFGSLGVAFIAKNWKIALPPIVLMIVLFIAVTPFFDIYGYASVLIPISALFTVLIARVMYNKGMLGEKGAPAVTADVAVDDNAETVAGDEIADETDEENDVDSVENVDEEIVSSSDEINE